MIRNKRIEHHIMPMLEFVKQDLMNDDSIIFAYVFGAYGVGNPKPLSDVDIATYLKENSSIWDKKLQLIERLTSILKTDEVDIVILNETSLILSYQVLKTGRLLFSKNEAMRIDFVSKVYDLYCDTEPLRNSARSNLFSRVQRGKIGTGQ